LAVLAASPAYSGPRDDYGPGGNPYPRTYPGPGGYPYWSGYVDAPVGQPIPPASGVPSVSGTVMLGACAACASAADQVAPEAPMDRAFSRGLDRLFPSLPSEPLPRLIVVRHGDRFPLLMRKDKEADCRRDVAAPMHYFRRG